MTYGDSLDDELFIDRIGSISVKQITRMAKDRRPGSVGFAEAMLIEYNGKRKNPAGKLLMSKLRARDLAQIDGVEEDTGYPPSAEKEGQKRDSTMSQRIDENQIILQMDEG